MKYYLNINREEASELISQLVRTLEFNLSDITFELGECENQSEGEKVLYISDREGK